MDAPTNGDTVANFSHAFGPCRETSRSMRAIFWVSRATFDLIRGCSMPAIVAGTIFIMENARASESKNIKSGSEELEEEKSGGFLAGNVVL